MGPSASTIRHNPSAISDLEAFTGSLRSPPLNSMYGSPAFDAIDELVEENRGILDEEEGVFYSMKSSGIQQMLQRRGLS